VLAPCQLAEATPVRNGRGSQPNRQGDTPLAPRPDCWPRPTAASRDLLNAELVALGIAHDDPVLATLVAGLHQRCTELDDALTGGLDLLAALL
jgi:hypothetical protein